MAQYYDGVGGERPARCCLYTAFVLLFHMVRASIRAFSIAIEID